VAFEVIPISISELHPNYLDSLATLTTYSVPPNMCLCWPFVDMELEDAPSVRKKNKFKRSHALWPCSAPEPRYQYRGRNREVSQCSILVSLPGKGIISYITQVTLPASWLPHLTHTSLSSFSFHRPRVHNSLPLSQTSHYSNSFHS
jgi:hypothetical protein